MKKTTTHNLEFYGLPLQVVGRFYKGYPATHEEPAEYATFEIEDVKVGGLYDVYEIFENSWDFAEKQIWRKNKLEELEEEIIVRFYSHGEQ